MKMLTRYQNRKLYDTQCSKYVTFDEVTQFVKDGVEFKIIDHKTRNDLTSATLIRIIYQQERQRTVAAPVELLKDMVVRGAELALTQGVSNGTP